MAMHLLLRPSVCQTECIAKELYPFVNRIDKVLLCCPSQGQVAQLGGVASGGQCDTA